MIKKDERDLIVFLKYTEVIKAAGKYATSLQKQSLYDETADYFFIEGKTCAKIIRSVLIKFRKGSMGNLFSAEESASILAIIDQIHSDKNDRHSINISREREAIQNPV